MCGEREGPGHIMEMYKTSESEGVLSTLPRNWRVPSPSHTQESQSRTTVGPRLEIVSFQMELKCQNYIILA